jgi:hypothetical protein
MACGWLEAFASGANTDGPLCNKMVHVLVLIFVSQFPHQWPTFFDEVRKQGDEWFIQGEKSQLAPC